MSEPCVTPEGFSCVCPLHDGHAHALDAAGVPSGSTVSEDEWSAAVLVVNDRRWLLRRDRPFMRIRHGVVQHRATDSDVWEQCEEVIR